MNVFCPPVECPDSSEVTITLTNLMTTLYGCLAHRDKMNGQTCRSAHRPPSCLHTSTVTLREENFGWEYPTDTSAASRQGAPVSIFFTKGHVLLILTFKSLSLTAVCSHPGLYCTATEGNQLSTRCNICAVT